MLGVEEHEHLRVFFVIGPSQEDLARGRKTGQVVHMPCGVIVGKKPQGEPDDLGHAQQLLQVALNLLAAQLGVAGPLGLAQEALLCGEQCSAWHALVMSSKCCLELDHEPHDSLHARCQIMLPSVGGYAWEPCRLRAGLHMTSRQSSLKV